MCVGGTLCLVVIGGFGGLMVVSRARVRETARGWRRSAMGVREYGGSSIIKCLCVLFVWGEWEEVEGGGDGGGAGVWAAGVSDVLRVLTDNVA